MLYRVRWSSVYDMTRHVTRWTDSRDVAVMWFHKFAASGNACSVFIEHKRREEE